MRHTAALLVFALALACGCDERKPEAGPAAEPVPAGVTMVQCLPCGGHEHVLDEKMPRSLYQGQTYYFCAEGCKTEFDADPTKFVKTPATRAATRPAGE